MRSFGMPRLLEILILTSLAITGCLATHGASLDRALQFHGIAQGNYLIGDKSGAVRALEECLQVQPDYMPALRLKVRIEIDDGQIEAARETIDLALGFQPDDIEIRLLEALLNGKEGEREKALAAIDPIIQKTGPETREGRIARQLFGIMQMAEGNWDDAAETFSSIAVDAPENRKLAVEAYLEKIDRLTGEGQFEAALDTLDQAIALYTESKKSHELERRFELRFQKAKLLVIMGNLSAAVPALEILLKENPDRVRILLTLASLYIKSEDWEAIEDILPKLQEEPALRDIVLYFEGRIALARNRVGTARAKFESALKIATEDQNRLRPTLHFYRGLCFAKLGRPADAETAMLRAVEIEFQPETATEAEQLGKTLLHSEHFQSAIPAIERTLLRGESSGELWAILARMHLKASQTSLAISAFNEALRLAPGNTEMLALRGSLLRKIGDLGAALADYQTALGAKPENPVVHYETGLVLLQLGRIPEAEEHLRTAARGLHEQPTLNLLYASTAYVVEEKEAALKSLDAYLNPSMEQADLDRHHRSISDTAIYLNDLLDDENGPELKAKFPISRDIQLFRAYRLGQSTRKEVLDWAGRADTQKQAREQISIAAFWLAQHEKEAGNTAAQMDLLKITIEYGTPEKPEWQFAQWQQRASSLN